MLERFLTETESGLGWRTSGALSEAAANLNLSARQVITWRAQTNEPDWIKIKHEPRVGCDFAEAGRCFRLNFAAKRTTQMETKLSGNWPS